MINIAYVSMQAAINACPKAQRPSAFVTTSAVGKLAVATLNLAADMSAACQTSTRCNVPFTAGALACDMRHLRLVCFRITGYMPLRQIPTVISQAMSHAKVQQAVLLLHSKLSQPRALAASTCQSPRRMWLL